MSIALAIALAIALLLELSIEFPMHLLIAFGCLVEAFWVSFSRLFATFWTPFGTFWTPLESFFGPQADAWAHFGPRMEKGANKLNFGRNLAAPRDPNLRQFL